MHQKIDYNEITDGIYIGTNQCCQADFDEHLLKVHSITVDISLEGERLDAPFGAEWYVWIPVENKTAPTHDQLAFGVEVLEKSVSLGRKIYVHCKNGHGRAPTLVAAYLIKTAGKNPQEAEELIRSKRPSVHLEEVQKDALKVFASNLRYLNAFNE